MNGILKYRIVALGLAMVFGVFNIGIPIIIASCPMIGMAQGSKCAMCDDQDDPATSKVTAEVNTSCCATTILAERNTNEFVQAKVNVQESALQAVLVLNPFAVSYDLSTLSAIAPISSSPPLVADIPILASSLLI
jgi:hypothetical protein